MLLEHLFSLCGAFVMPCWVLLAVAPGARWSQRLATLVMPVFLACVYLWLIAFHRWPAGAGFGSLAQVAVLFHSPYALLAGWLHYLAFDLFTGAWEARDAVRLGIARGWLVPCLLLTFLLGPVGLAAWLMIRFMLRRQAGEEVAR